MYYNSPLRYPGGKTKLAEYVKALLVNNDLQNGEYAEPYAGGASIALELIISGVANKVHINDLDPSVWAFWHAVLEQNDDLCRLILDTPVDMHNWYIQKEIQKNKTIGDPLALGFSTFFLNRTNRSGILTAGVIGGKGQAGPYKIDARYSKPELIRRIKLIGEHRHKISLHRLDAIQFLKKIVSSLPDRTFVYLDPPYYNKGGDLYEHHYKHNDHILIAAEVEKITKKWMVSYDDVPEIRALYAKHQHVSYTLNYCAQNRYRGKEAIFLGPSLECPGLKASMRAQ